MRKLLIATVSEATSTALAETLSQYEVHICSTGTDALKLIDVLHPDILILDLMLPYMDGLTVLRKSGFRPPVILALTNLLAEFVLRAAADVGVQDVLLIPSATHYIVARLEALLDKVPSPEL